MGYTKEMKSIIICELKNGIKVGEICKKYKVSKATIYNWLKSTKTISKDTNITFADYEKLQKSYVKKF
jgi:transposase